MQLLEETAARDDFRMDYDLQPGDMQFINNHTILHARGAFEDWEDEKEGGKRHLLRTWISPPNGRSVKRLPIIPYHVKASCLNCLEILALRMLSLIGTAAGNCFVSSSTAVVIYNCV